MTTGVLERFPVAHLAVAVTGIAGPDGGTPDKPVGLTYVAAALRDGPAIVERHQWPFDRDGNKRASVLAVLELATRVTSEASPVMNPGERIHVIGIAGSGAAGAALLLHHAGARVDGCDADAPSPYTPPLDAAGIGWVRGHDATHVASVDRVGITPALRAVPHHDELRAAEQAGIPVVTWQALLGELMAAPGRVGIGVTGTHGKSTTTALLGHLLASAGMDPTVEVGAFIGAWGASVRAGSGAPFVVEADEFGDNFLNYHPAVAIVTNVEMDHPDYFADTDAVMASFERFVRGMGTDASGGRLLVTAAADPGAAALVERLAGWDGRVVRYGPAGEIEATEVELGTQTARRSPCSTAASR